MGENSKVIKVNKVQMTPVIERSIPRRNHKFVIQFSHPSYAYV